MKQLGNIQFLIITIGSVVFFTLLLITGNTMAIAVRERTGEFAVLKAVGFSDRFVLFFVMAESLLISLIGGGLGIVTAKAIAAWHNPVPNVLPFFKVPNQALIMGFALALTVGLDQRHYSGDWRHAPARCRRAEESVRWRYLLFTTCAV